MECVLHLARLCVLAHACVCLCLHTSVHVCVCYVLVEEEEEQAEDHPVLNVKRRSRQSSLRLDQRVPAGNDAVNQTPPPSLHLPCALWSLGVFTSGVVVFWFVVCVCGYSVYSSQ